MHDNRYDTNLAQKKLSKDTTSWPDINWWRILSCTKYKFRGTIITRANVGYIGFTLHLIINNLQDQEDGIRDTNGINSLKTFEIENNAHNNNARHVDVDKRTTSNSMLVILKKGINFVYVYVYVYVCYVLYLCQPLIC